MTAMSARDSTSVHRRQFVVGPRPVMAECGWRHVSLSDGLHLSHCPSLPRASVTAWIFVVRPPRERPMALPKAPLLRRPPSDVL